MNVMWRTIARIVSRPIYQQIGSMEFYKASVENREGVFDCSFGKKVFQDYSPEKEICLLKCKKNKWGFACKEVEFLDNNEELTWWEEVATEEKRFQAFNSDKQTKNSEEFTKHLIQIEEEIEELKSRLSRLEEVNNFLEKQPKKEEYQEYIEITPKFE